MRYCWQAAAIKAAEAMAHQLTVDIERRLKERFGPNTLISIHVEPIETEKLSSSDSEKDKNI